MLSSTMREDIELLATLDSRQCRLFGSWARLGIAHAGRLVVIAEVLCRREERISRKELGEALELLQPHWLGPLKFTMSAAQVATTLRKCKKEGFLDEDRAYWSARERLRYLWEKDALPGLYELCGGYRYPKYSQ